MHKQDERLLIYTALVILCGIASVVVGLTGSLWAMLQIVAVVEFIYWIGTPADDSSVGDS